MDNILWQVWYHRNIRCIKPLEMNVRAPNASTAISRVCQRLAEDHEGPPRILLIKPAEGEL